jgi:hypothetical protein
MLNSNESLNPKRPKPIISETELFVINRRVNIDEIIEALLHHNYVLIKDFFSTGLEILAALKKHLRIKYPEQHFQGQRDFRFAFRDASQNLLLPIKDNKLAVRKAPHIGWLKQLYPDISEFLLSFPDVQGLNSAWQWYEKGIMIPVIRQRIYPYYGTYFPTRFEHLELFSNWLKNYKGPKKTAIDIGTGCGILSFQLLQHSFVNVFATDINENAIIGVNEEIIRMHLKDKLFLYHGDLFEPLNLLAEVIVFNPPWLPSNSKLDGLDNAIYYDQELFPRFFKQARKHLEINGKLVILFSNLAQSSGMTKINPIEEELTNGNRFKKDHLILKKVRAASNKTDRDLNRRKNELVELWVLSAI